MLRVKHQPSCGPVSRAELIAQLDVPVGEIDEVSPALVMLCAESHVHERTPLRALRSADQRHVGLVREAVPLSRIAGDARADHVLPRRQSTAIPRQDVVEVQIRPLKNSAAILAGVLVALENVVPGKLHFLFRQPIEEQQDDHARHPDLPRDGRHHFVFRRRGGEVAPAVEVVGQEIIPGIGGNDLSVTLVKQGKGTARRADIDRLP